MPCKYTSSTQKYLLPFITLNFKIKKKSVKLQLKKLFMTEYCMVGATNLRQLRIFYTTAGCDG